MVKSAITVTDIGYDNDEADELVVFLKVHYKRFTCNLLSRNPACIEHSKRLTNVIHAFHTAWKSGKNHGIHQGGREIKEYWTDHQYSAVGDSQ